MLESVHSHTFLQFGVAKEVWHWFVMSLVLPFHFLFDCSLMVPLMMDQLLKMAGFLLYLGPHVNFCPSW